MPQYLIDVNLPRHFTLWGESAYLHQCDLAPKVIHVRLGNLKIKQLNDALSAIWPDIIALNKTHKLINIFPDRIEGIR